MYGPVRQQNRESVRRREFSPSGRSVRSSARTPPPETAEERGGAKKRVANAASVACGDSGCLPPSRLRFRSSSQGSLGCLSITRRRLTGDCYCRRRLGRSSTRLCAGGWRSRIASPLGGARSGRRFLVYRPRTGGRVSDTPWSRNPHGGSPSVHPRARQPRGGSRSHWSAGVADLRRGDSFGRTRNRSG